MKCCGFDVKTRYCPHCGASNEAARPIDSLRAYVRSTATSRQLAIETELSRAAEVLSLSVKEGRITQEQADRQMSKVKVIRMRVVDKWKAWADALDELMRKNLTE